jgi:AmmeMemoRadiSam system protein A
VLRSTFCVLPFCVLPFCVLPFYLLRAMKDADRQSLLKLARSAIEARVKAQTMPAPGDSEVFGHMAGAFVTIHKRGQLRGCIGHVEADEPLGRVVTRCAVAAASSDPRFSPIAPDELPDLHIELSVLGPLERIERLDNVEIGRHGLVVEQGWHRGLLLPQVAVEWKWDRETFAAETCRKAGLDSGAWASGAKMWCFEAEVFAEPGV